MTEPDPDTWQDALTRRLRTLVRTAPLHRFETSKGLRDVELAGVDVRALCLRGLDVTIERMGFSDGIPHDALKESLTPLIRMMRPDFSAAQIADVSSAVLDNLLNERERRLEFREPYVSFEQDTLCVREACFRLLCEKQLPSGEIVLKATTEAINLYAGMLEFPVEDAQDGIQSLGEGARERLKRVRERAAAALAEVQRNASGGSCPTR